MRDLFRRIGRALRRDIRIQPVAVRPGDDLIFAPGHWPASQDAVAFLNAAQEQFPGVRLHLLIGFAGIQVQRNSDSDERCCRADEGGCKPGKGSQEAPSVVVSPLTELGQQRAAVVLGHATGGRIIATTVPPKVKSDPVEKLHSILPVGGDGITAVRGNQLRQIAEDILREARPDLFQSEAGSRHCRLLARKMRRAAAKVIANRPEEASHA